MTLLNMPDAGTPRGIRTRALFRVLYYTALRANAVCSLRWGQMQKQDGQWGLMDVHTKRDKYVSPALHPEAIKWLLLWRDVYEDMVDEIRPDDPIFPAFVRDSVSFILDGDKRPQAMTRQGLWWLVRHECAVMGLDIPDGMSVGPHTFRHAFTRHARNRGAGLEQISQALNHANLGTTQNYLARFPDFDWAHHPARVLPVPEQPETA
jgi:integrase/recombinase XerD